MRKRRFLLAAASMLVVLLAGSGSLEAGAVALQKGPSAGETTSSTTKAPTKTPPSTAKAPATAPTQPSTSKPSNFRTEWGGNGTKWGERGSSDGQFSSPHGIAIDRAGNVYVADTYNNRIQKFSANGDFIKTWGESGSGNGQFSELQGIATDPSGNVYVVDADTGIPAFRGAVARVQEFDSNGRFIKKWGEYGSGSEQFDSPRGIAIDRAGNVYVADTDNDRIQKFDSKGNFITQWGERGYPSSAAGAEGKFYGPRGIATDSAGNVYVADTYNNRIQKFDPNGKFIRQWGKRGEDDGQFSEPVGIATDSSDNVYVVDSSNNRIQVFDSNGRFLGKWGESGSDNGQFSFPSYIAIDATGNVYVTDTGNNRIQKFSYTPPQLVPPIAPSDLNVKAIDSNSIQVDWVDNSANEDGFEISNGETSTTVGTDVTTYTWTGLTPGTYMCFKVRAFNTVGSSAFTPAECTTTPSTGTGGKTTPTDTTGTKNKGGTTSTPGTNGGSDGGIPKAIENVWEDVPDAVDDAFGNLGEGRLPDTGGGWVVLLLVGAALVGGGWFLVRLGRRFSG